MFDEFVGDGLLPFLQDNQGLDPLAPFFVGNTDDGRLCNSRMAVEDILDFLGVYIFTAALDHILQPVDIIEITLLIQFTYIAGVLPPAPKGP